MRITTKAVWGSTDDFIAGKQPDTRESFDYDGPVAKLDRAATDEAKTAANTAGSTASNLSGKANAIGGTLTPFYQQEMNTEHAFNPDQLNELLNFSEMGAGGANSTIDGMAKSEEARTRNTTGFTSALDQAARDKQQALSQDSLGIGAKDIEGAKALNQAGAAGEANMYGEDTKGMLDAMGVQQGDIKDQIEAGQSGWFQNLTGFMKAAGELAGGIGGGLAGAAKLKGGK